MRCEILPQIKRKRSGKTNKKLEKIRKSKWNVFKKLFITQLRKRSNVIPHHRINRSTQTNDRILKRIVNFSSY
jgi:hypothetical protein